MTRLNVLLICSLFSLERAWAGGFWESYEKIVEGYVSNSKFTQSSASANASASIPVSLGFGMTSFSTEQWGSNTEFHCLLVQDMIGGLVGKHGSDSKPSLSSWFSFAYGLNLFTTESLILAAGVNANYYGIGEDSTVKASETGAKAASYAKFNPGAGSYLRADFMVTQAFGLRVRNEITKTLVFDNAKLSPVVLKIGGEIFTRGGWFVGGDWYRDYTGLNLHTTRLDLKAGVRFGFPGW